MKLIIAYIRPEVLQDVKTRLYAKEIYSLSVTNVLGSGRQKGYTEVYRGVQTEVNLLKKLRLEIGLADELVDTAIEAICEGAKTGATGDGVIFVLEVGKNLRIRTQEPV
jgi:nitrogen regulatory protein P-II 1